MPMELSGLSRVIPLVVIEHKSDIIPLAKCLVEAQLTTIEVAMRNDNAISAITHFREAGIRYVGAGTVDTIHKLDQAVEAGANFGLSPSLGLDVLERAQDIGWTFIPGAATPSEVAVLSARGCDVVKLFPAHFLGGAGYISALAEVFPNTGFVPTGGISRNDFRNYLQMRNVRAVGGSWPIPKDLVRDKKWGEITKHIAEVQTGDER